MKRTLYIFLLASFSLVTQAKMPKFITKARLAQVSIIAQDANGKLNEGQGVILNDKGEILTEYDILKGAVKATVFDSKGNEYPVSYLCGASSMYNVAKISIEPGKAKLAFLETDSTEIPASSQVYILPNVKADKKAIPTEDTITANQKFRESYNYYTLTHSVSERQIGSPVLNAEGHLVGIVQAPAKEGDAGYVIDARFGADMQISVLDAGNADLRSILLPKRLPAGEEAAASFIILSGVRDTAQYLAYVDDFIRLYPSSSTGYVMKAEILAAGQHFADAEKAYEEGLAQEATKKDELHYSLAKVIYELNLNPQYRVYQDWNIERSISEAQKAFEANPQNIYQSQQAHSLYVAKRYDEACNLFLTLTKTNLRSPELFLYAAQCKQAAEAPIEDIIALQDSAVNCYSKPYPQAAANAILMRGTNHAKAGHNREAVADFNDYEHLVGGNLSANFYYEREQLEVKCRMYAAALNDIERAIKLMPNEPLLYAECAALNYRVGQVDEAIHYAEQAIKTDSKFPDAYRILGVCLNEKGNKQKAREYLKKAIELGDTLAQGVLDKMK